MATLTQGEGGQECVRVSHSAGASAEIYLWGATVTSYKTAKGRELLWLSSKALFNGEKALRGGIPLAFPQFGRPDDRMAQHGFARNNKWEYLGDTQEDDDVVVSFGLNEDLATHEAWPHPYRLTYDVRVGESALSTALKVTNTGDEAFTFQCLQHTYFNVGVLAETRVEGFQGCKFFDKVSSSPDTEVQEDRAEVGVDAETDRIYLAPVPDPLLVKCPAGDFSVSKTAKLLEGAIDSALAPDTVFWNPWEEKAAGMSDFAGNDNPKAGHTEMLCIEPGLVNGMTTLMPGATAGLTQVASSL